MDRDKGDAEEQLPLCRAFPIIPDGFGAVCFHLLLPDGRPEPGDSPHSLPLLGREAAGGGGREEAAEVRGGIPGSRSRRETRGR